MSDALDAALAGIASKGQAPPDPLDASLAKIASGQTVSAPQPTSSGFTHVGQQIYGLGSGAYHSIVGGYKGIFDLATGKGLDTAVSDISKESAKSYQSPESDLSNMPAAIRPIFRNMNTPMKVTAFGDWAASHGASPLVSAALAAAPAALAGMMTGGAGEAVGPMSAEEAFGSSLAKQSQGAAAATPNLANISTPLRSAIEKAGAETNPDAAIAHIEAEKHGVQLMKGQANRDPIQFSNEQNSTNSDIVARKNVQEQQMTDALDNIRAEATPNTVQNNPIENGQIAVDALKNYDAPIKADISAKYKALTDANGGSVPIDSGSFVDQVESALKKKYLTSSIPPAGAELINSLKNGEPLDFEGFEAARTRLAEAQRQGGSSSVAASIIRDHLEQLPLPADAVNLKGLADTARAAAKARFDAVDRDPAYQAAVDDAANGVKSGDPSPLADKFLDKYIMNAPKANLSTVLQKLTPDAKEAVTSHALNQIKSAVVKPNGTVSPHGFNSAMAKIAPKADLLIPPNVLDDLGTLQRTVTRAKVPPAGDFVNVSKSGVLRNAATGISNVVKGAGGEVLNKVTLGLGGKVIGHISDANFAKDALAPGAGINP